MKSLKKMKFATQRVADVSTGELMESDLALIMNRNCPCRCFEHDDGTGAIFYVPLDDQPEFDEAVKEWRAFGMSENFVGIMMELRRQEFGYVLFDADAPEIENG